MRLARLDGGNLPCGFALGGGSDQLSPAGPFNMAAGGCLVAFPASLLPTTVVDLALLEPRGGKSAPPAPFKMG